MHPIEADNPYLKAMKAEANRYHAFGVHFFIVWEGGECEIRNDTSELLLEDTTDGQKRARYKIQARKNGTVLGELSVSMLMQASTANCTNVVVHHHEDGSKPSQEHRISDTLGRIYIDFVQIFQIRYDSGFAYSREGAAWVGRLHASESDKAMKHIADAKNVAPRFPQMQYRVDLMTSGRRRFQ